MQKKSKPTENFFQENREAIGKQIQESRVKRGFGQHDLAEIMEVNHLTISKVEEGKFAITIYYLAKFAWYLDLNISVVEKHCK